MSSNCEFLRVVNSLLKRSQRFILVDGGARNKTWELSTLAPFCDVLSFEPNSSEYAKVISNTTDLEKICKLKDLPYRHIEYSDLALSDEIGVSTLNITRGPGSCSLLEPNSKLISQLEWCSFEKKIALECEVIETRSVRTTTLDKIAREKGFDRIDYLKLDTQGNELDCLKGACDLLQEKKIGVIKIEVEFLELYKGQGLFADLDNFLRLRGFMLLDLTFDQRHKVRWTQNKMGRDRGTLLFADAYYTLSIGEHANLDPEDTIRHSLILGELGFTSFASLLLQSLGGGVDSGSLAVLKRWWGRDARKWKTKIKDRIGVILRFLWRFF